MGWRTILQAPRNMAGKVEKQARLIVGGNNVNCFMFHSKLNSQHFKEEEEKKKKKMEKEFISQSLSKQTHLSCDHKITKSQ